MSHDLYLLKDLFDGRKKMQAAHDLEEKQKLHTFRVGSGGVMIGGQPVGTCPRLAVGRYFGVNRTTDDSRLLMFAAGLANEDIVCKELDAALEGTGYSYLREEDVPISWKTKGGTSVSGRPDIVVGKSVREATGSTRFSPEVIMEMKLVSALWTARDVAFKKKPKPLHLVQAGHYSSELGVPAEIHYVSRADFQVPTEKWAQPHFQTDRADLVERNDKNLVKKVLPFHVAYRLDWDGDRLMWMNAEGGGWEETPVTKSGIKDYFEYLDSCIQEKRLPQRPPKTDAIGEVMHYDACDPKYCQFSNICDTCSKTQEQWLEAAAKLTEKK